MIRGLVQGVGFRPFICRLAAKHGLYGEVDNRTDGVSVIVRCDLKSVGLFSNDILENAPPASQIKSIEVNPRNIENYDSFRIVTSKNIDERITEISPDIAVCDECLNDLEKDRERINYPFINCTNCGPRFTIITGLPYDRINTTMKSFRMCDNCSSEYNNIMNRRFHAQPVACNSCGPEYICKNYKDPGKSISRIDKILEEVSLQISNGKTVAIKGLGGYHLMCDALSNDAVTGMRKRKLRDSKPFAVMFRDISDVRNYCYISNIEEKELLSWRRPIMILKQKNHLSEAVNHGLNTIGAMLPYMPVHYMLFRILDTPAVVLTSGNISDEPIIIDDKAAVKCLTSVADSIISYNREIWNRTDDSVVRIINNKTSIIRRSRGFVPRPVDLFCNVEGIIATGAEQKNSFCIGKDHQAVMSQYIGDLKNLSTFDFFTESVERFMDLFKFKPGYIACDLHPGYLSTLYADDLERDLKIPIVRVQHHHAHIASCMAEHGLDEKVIGVSMDGTGYGIDGNIWGSEFLIADLAGFERFSHFDYIQLPGGDRAVEEPWRTAFSILHKYFGEHIDYKSIPVFKSIEPGKLLIVREMLVKNINAPLTCGAGRFFDAVSALTGLCPVTKFDSEAPMRLESAITCDTDLYYPFSIDGTIMFADTFKEILNDLPQNDISFISAKFHNTIAQVILEVSKRIRKRKSLKKVVISGGVFQNKYLLEKSLELLINDDFDVYTNHLVPTNDGGVSLGQLIIASKRLGLCV